MSASSTKQETRTGPVQNSEPGLETAPSFSPNFTQGFGQGANFRYKDSGSYQSDWAKRKYSSFADTDNDVPPNKESAARAVAAHRPANDDKILSPVDRLMFATEVSIRYHSRRKTHYENTFKLMMAGVVVMAFGTLLAGFGGRIWLLAGVAALGLGTLVWNISAKGREHAVLREQYQNMLEQIQMTFNPSDEIIRGWSNQRQRIQSREPPVFWAVANDCYYETARSWAMRPMKRGMPPIWLRPFVNWFRF